MLLLKGLLVKFMGRKMSDLGILCSHSPNFDDRTSPISSLVMHYTGMKTGKEALERLLHPRKKSRGLAAQRETLSRRKYRETFHTAARVINHPPADQSAQHRRRSHPDRPSGLDTTLNNMCAHAKTRCQL